MAPAAASTIIRSPRNLQPQTNSSSPSHLPVPLERLRASPSNSGTLSTSSSSWSPSSSTINVSPPQTELDSQSETHHTPPTTPSQSVLSHTTSPSLLPWSAPSDPPASGDTSNGPSFRGAATEDSSASTPPERDVWRQQLRKWLHIRTWWQGSIAVFTLAIGVVGLVYSAYRTYELALWTAAKEWHEKCQAEKAADHLVSGECEKALSRVLTPPPYGYTEFFTDLTKRFSGYRHSKDATSTENPTGNSTRALAFCDKCGENNIFYFDVRYGWLATLLFLCLSSLICAVNLFLLYRRLSPPAVVEHSVARTAASFTIIREPPGEQYPGLRRRRDKKRRTNYVSEYDPDDQELEVYGWDDDSLYGPGAEISNASSVKPGDFLLSGKQPFSTKVSTEHKHKRSAWFDRFLQGWRKKNKTLDVARSIAVAEAHEQASFTSEPLKAQNRKQEIPPAGTLLATPTTKHPARTHAVALKHIVPPCELDLDKPPKSKLKPKEGAAHFGVAQAGAGMAATSGGSAMKRPLVENCEAKGDTWMPQVPQDAIMMTMINE